jgi:hypothetical protein
VSTVRAHCGTCGDVELAAGDVHAMVCVDTGQGSWRFRCPKCRMTVVKPCEPCTIDLLVASGAGKTMWSLPLELAEPHAGPPISHDDQLDFHQRLYDEAEFRRGLDEMRGEPA